MFVVMEWLKTINIEVEVNGASLENYVYIMG